MAITIAPAVRGTAEIGYPHGSFGRTSRITGRAARAAAFVRRVSQAGVLALLLASPTPWAAGTTAGTNITNTATLRYVLGNGTPSTATSSATIRVDEVIQPLLTWQDAAAVPVNSPGRDAVLIFLLTNVGNGTESFSLRRTNGPTPLPPGNYTPLNGTVGSIYIETGALPGFQATGPNADRLYVPGVNEPTLSPDAGVLIYVVSDTPHVANNMRGDVRLTASSLTVGAAGAPMGTALAGLGQGGGFAVVGSGRGQTSATGSYITSGLSFIMNKTVIQVTDPHGGAVVMAGAVLTYQIVATLSGSGIATNFVVTDPMPENTTFVAGSIVLDGAAQSDAADVDRGQWIAANRVISITLGTVPAPANFVITFRVTID